MSHSLRLLVRALAMAVLAVAVTGTIGVLGQSAPCLAMNGDSPACQVTLDILSSRSAFFSFVMPAWCCMLAATLAITVVSMVRRRQRSMSGAWLGSLILLAITPGIDFTVTGALYPGADVPPFAGLLTCAVFTSGGIVLWRASTRSLRTEHLAYAS